MSLQERFCYYCNGDHKGTECPIRHPKSADEELETLVCWLDQQIAHFDDKQVVGKNYLIWLRSIVKNKHYYR